MTKPIFKDPAPVYVAPVESEAEIAKVTQALREIFPGLQIKAGKWGVAKRPRWNVFKLHWFIAYKCAACGRECSVPWRLAYAVLAQEGCRCTPCHQAGKLPAIEAAEVPNG